MTIMSGELFPWNHFTTMSYVAMLEACILAFKMVLIMAKITNIRARDGTTKEGMEAQACATTLAAQLHRPYGRQYKHEEL